MKKKVLSNVLCACCALSFWFGSSVISAIFFGEYTYPDKKQYED